MFVKAFHGLFAIGSMPLIIAFSLILFSPVKVKSEIIMQCNLFDSPGRDIFFKFEKSFIFGKKIFIRQDGNWRKFCVDGKPESMHRYCRNCDDNNIPLLLDSGDNSFQCIYNNRDFHSVYKVILDFDLVMYSQEKKDWSCLHAFREFKKKNPKKNVGDFKKGNTKAFLNLSENMFCDWEKVYDLANENENCKLIKEK